MKKKNEWLTKSQKRKLKKKDKGIVDLIKIIFHFFSELPQWIDEMTDPRNESYITYTQQDYIYMGLLKNVCSAETMREMDELFNEDNCIETLAVISGDEELDKMPHRDSLNYYLSMLSPKCLSDIRNKMIHKLIKSKVFNKNRLLGKHWRIILDGTGLFYFKEKHCDNCLVEVHTDENGNKTKRYYHKVLEAKLVLSDSIVVSIGTEFIENESEDVTKQDCETNAAKRLIARIKEEYPRLNICLQGDALYETEPLMEICRLNGWKYIFTHKSGRQGVVDENYALLDECDGKKKKTHVGKEGGEAKYYNGLDKLAGKSEMMNIFEYGYEYTQGGVKCKKTFIWVTNIELSYTNIGKMVDAARGRWHIENEGFNNQKNGIYKIEHLNSHDNNAMKNHYLLTQIADIIMQLYLAWNPLVRKIGQTIKVTSSRLLETFRLKTITQEDVEYIQRHTSIYLE